MIADCCAFTGHRPHKFPWRYDETDSRCVALKAVEPASQERYHSILNQADSVEYVSRGYYNGCMLDRNHRLVEAAGLLLAVYNGERRGGTAATVRYARKLGRKTMILNPNSLEIVTK